MRIVTFPERKHLIKWEALIPLPILDKLFLISSTTVAFWGWINIEMASWRLLITLISQDGCRKIRWRSCKPLFVFVSDNKLYNDSPSFSLFEWIEACCSILNTWSDLFLSVKDNRLYYNKNIIILTIKHCYRFALLYRYCVH